MPRHHRLHAAAEGLDVERAAEADPHEQVVDGAARVQLLEEPHPLLAEGQRQLTAVAGQRTQGHRGRVDAAVAAGVGRAPPLLGAFPQQARE